MTKRIEYTVGKLCPRHPELAGRRYVSGGCAACTRERRRRTYTRKAAQAKTAAERPVRDSITAQVEAEVLAERRAALRDLRREERRRALLREEYGGRV